MSERGQHTLSLRVPNLTPGKIACLTCLREMTKEEWAASTCGGPVRKTAGAPGAELTAAPISPGQPTDQRRG